MMNELTIIVFAGYQGCNKASLFPTLRGKWGTKHKVRVTIIVDITSSHRETKITIAELKFENAF